MTLQEFDAYIQDALLNPKYSPQERRQLLIHWEKVTLYSMILKLTEIMR